MIVVAVVWQANEGHENEVAELFQKLEVASRQEPGCLMYVVHRPRTDAGRFFIYEQYRDEAALQQHHESEHFQQYAVQQLRKIATRVDGQLYEPLTPV